MLQVRAPLDGAYVGVTRPAPVLLLRRATAVHRLLQDVSTTVLGYQPVWPWEAAMRR